MEYSCHGNLKEYLDRYRQTILQSGQSLFISNSCKETTSGLDCNIIIAMTLVSGDVNDDIKERLPAMLSQSDVQNFAFQIACGLEHLEAMEVGS